jgi:hypothetical protein
MGCGEVKFFGCSGILQMAVNLIGGSVEVIVIFVLWNHRPPMREMQGIVNASDASGSESPGHVLEPSKFRADQLKSVNFSRLITLAIVSGREEKECESRSASCELAPAYQHSGNIQYM